MAARNLKLTFSYDGANFSGYELQPGRRTVRGEIEKALRIIFKQTITITSAARTDAGVHALQNVINFKAANESPLAKIPIALNSVLPEDIRMLKADAVRRRFNARFAAKSKEYEYLIYNGEVLSPLIRNFVWHVKPKLNLSAMRKAAKFLVGKHDFSSFCAAGGDDNNFVRIIHSLEIGHWSLDIWKGIKVVRFKVVGSGFLYKMVRNIVGTLIDVGLGRISVEDVRRILAAKDRRLAGRTAPARGLCLVKVCYN